MINPSKTLVIIGGSRGIGASTAKLAFSKGYRVVIGYQKQRTSAKEIVSQINVSGGVASAYEIDITSFSSVEMFFKKIVNTYGVPDAVVQCAGYSKKRQTLMDMTEEDIVGILAVNLTGTFFCLRAAAKIMSISRGGNGGSIVTLSPEAARFGGNGISVYAASKAGINAMTLGVARELATEKIRLNSVSPGVINTDLNIGDNNPNSDPILMTIPLGRRGSPEEVANAILWLISDEASYITGSILTVAGGR